jgi:hypothetical protein
VWLNEAQFYLDPAEGGLGERVAAGLRELLRDTARAPVLALATLWPRYWDTLTARPADGPDPHAQARELLAGHDITVPPAFTPAQLGPLAQARDARLALAAAEAQDGQVIQFLAGAPELLARYRNAPPAAAALISAAMDARRLGTGIGLPRAFLAAAAPGYLTDAEWDALGEDWLAQALAYTAVPCRGVRGPLTPIRSRPARPGAPDGGDQPSAGQAGLTGGPLYRLADYLDQHGRAYRKDQIPPAGFWIAAADHALPDDQAALGLPPTPAACTAPPPSSARTPPLPATSALRTTSATLRPASAVTPAPRPGPPPTPPSTTRTPWPGCWTACGRRARASRPPRCWTVIRPPTPPSTTRTPWPGCWTACGRRARASRPPRWQSDCRRQACSSSSLSGVAVRISSISGGRPMAARARDGAGKTWTYDLPRQPGFRRRSRGGTEGAEPQGRKGPEPLQAGAGEVRAAAAPRAGRPHQEPPGGTISGEKQEA